MSIHSSLRNNDNVIVKRNVLKRYERVDLLKKQGKLKEGQRAWNLPKTKAS